MKVSKKEKTEFLTLNGIVQWASLTKPRPAHSDYQERYETDLILTDKSLAKSLVAQGVTIKTLVSKDKLTNKDTQIAIADGVPVNLIGNPVIKSYKNTVKKDGSKATPVALQDSNNNTIKSLTVGGEDVGIGNGSEVNLLVAVNKYEERGTRAEKARLALVAAQIIKLVPYQKQGAFSAVAGGYIADAVGATTVDVVVDTTDDDLPY